MEAGGDQTTVRLFQYGSNMHGEQFIQRIRDEYERHAPSGTPILVTLLGRGRLDGWRFQANLWSATRARRVPNEARVANIVKASVGEVWGALYEIAADLVTRCDGERSVVDRLEGHRTTSDPENYAKICITVDLDGEPRTAWTYIGLRESDRPLRARPSGDNVRRRLCRHGDRWRRIDRRPRPLPEGAS